MHIVNATAELTQDLGRSPTPRELSERIGCTVEEIIEGLESSNAYSTLSLDATDDGSDEPGGSMLDALGIDDPNLEHVEVRESIKPMLDQLDPREKRILVLRFFKNMTQTQIAEEVGISQMHVSRLLTRTLDQMRVAMQDARYPTERALLYFSSSPFGETFVASMALSRWRGRAVRGGAGR